MSRRIFLCNLLKGKSIDVKGYVGQSILDDEGILMCMKTGKNMSIVCNTEEFLEKFGIEFKGYLNPIKDNGEVVGVVCLSVGLEKEKAMDEVINDVVESVSQVSAAVNKITEGFKDVDKVTSNLVSEITTANENAKNSDEIVGIIQGISKQTNLLGLNASIEAARAGEFGKGFTVVAQEIRKLSQSSKESIDKIDGIIKNMAGSLSSIDKTLSRAGEVSQVQLTAIEEITAATNELSRIAKRLKDLSKEI